jgi:hypothetical protein
MEIEGKRHRGETREEKHTRSEGKRQKEIDTGEETERR